MYCHAKIRISLIRDSETASFYTLAIDNIVKLKNEDITLPCPFDLASNQPYGPESVPECVVHNVTNKPCGDRVHYFEAVRITKVPTDNHLDIIH